MSGALLGNGAVAHELGTAGQALLEHRLVVHRMLERLVDLARERLHHRRCRALETEGDALARRRRLLDGFDVDATFGILVEHTLSSSHVGLFVQLGFMQIGGANAALPALSDRR